MTSVRHRFVFVSSVLLLSLTSVGGCWLDRYFPSTEFYVYTGIREVDAYYGESSFADPYRSFSGSAVQTYYSGGTSASGTTNGNGYSTQYGKSTPARWQFSETDGTCSNMTLYDNNVANRGTVPLICRVNTGYQYSQYDGEDIEGTSVDYNEEVVEDPYDLGTNFLFSNDAMEPNDVLTAGGGEYSLTFQSDGNLVLHYLGAQALWDSDTAGQGAHAVMGSDGNFVIFNSGWSEVWSTGTYGNSGAYLNVQDDSNLVVYSSTDVPLWSVW